jgi:hypothetical protein
MSASRVATPQGIQEEGTVGEWPARAITIGSIVLTVASLTVAVLFAREATGSVVAFAVDPAQPDLLAQVNEALGAMADPGT